MASHGASEDHIECERRPRIFLARLDSDFGDFKVIPSRFCREQTGYVIDPEFWKVVYLRDFKQEEIAKTGDAIKRALLVEYTLQASNQASSGVIADLNIT